MIQTGIESRVKIQDVISSQLPNFILDESPKTADFLKQYYISQEYQSGVVDIAENLDQYPLPHFGTLVRYNIALKNQQSLDLSLIHI